MSSSSVNIIAFDLPGIASNITYLSQCAPDLCSLDYAVIRYVPNLIANGAFAGVFGTFLIMQIVAWGWYRTHSFSFTMCCGLVLEVVGYVARVVMRERMFVEGPFLVQITTLTLAPVFFTAALYLTLLRVIPLLGPQNSRLSPRSYTLTFLTSDIIALILQSVGGALADTASTLGGARTGTNIMVAGLAFQVTSLTIFSILCAEFLWNVRKDRKHDEAVSWALRKKAETKIPGMNVLISAFALATLLIWIRSAFRIVELAHGFQGKLANNQIAFMVLEGGVMVLATSIMTAFQPGRLLGGKGVWRESGWGKGKKEGITLLSVRRMDSDETGEDEGVHGIGGGREWPTV